MAFVLSNWSRQSVALNTGEVDVNGTETGGPAWFTYRSGTDTVATIAGANYFASVVYDLSVNDFIFVVGTDAVGLYTVATLDRAAGTITLVGASLTGSVNTANIVDGAVTAAKLASDSVTTAKILDANVTTAKLANNAVTSAKLALNVLQYATVAITAAEFNGMYAAPKLLVAAGGANTLLVLDKLDLVMTYGTANYAAGGVAAVQYDSTINGAGVIASSTLAAATFQAAASTTFTFNGGVVPAPFTTTANKGLYLSNITGAFTTGDSAMVAHIWYKVISLI